MTDPQPILAALADPTRRTVFEHLTAQGPASASALAEALPVSRQAIAKHLSQLNSVGLVERSEKGREVLYSARVAGLSQMAGWLESVGAAWDSRLDRLRQSFDA